MPIFRTGCMAVLSIALVAACSSGGLPPKAAPAPTPSGPKFDGTYRFDFDGTQQLAGGAPKPTQSRARNYAVRSHCTDSGCIATATKLADNDSKRKSDPPLDLVLDYFDGHWQMVHREDSTCTDGDIKGPSITAWVLQPQPDGALTGISYVAMNPESGVRRGDPNTDHGDARERHKCRYMQWPIPANSPRVRRLRRKASADITARQAFCKGPRNRGCDESACRRCACATPSTARPSSRTSRHPRPLSSTR